MPPNKITIIAADDHPIVVNGIKLSLIDATEFEFVAEAFSEASLYSVLQEQTADLLILDLNFKGDNSLQYLDRIYQLRPHIKVIIFSSYNAPSLIKSAMSHRIHGYLLKDTPRAKLIDALHRIHAGERYLPPRMEGENNPFDSDHGLVDDFLKKNNLSHRELEVIQLIVEGLTSQDIASQLYISKHTVQSHRKNILRKLRLHDKADIIKFAYENKLV